MDARRSIAEGMTVYTRDGEKLGKVVAVDDTGLFVEKGFFFPKEYGFRFVDVADVRDDEVHLRLDKEEVSQALVADEQGLERRRPSAVSKDRDRLAGTGRSDEAGLLESEANPPSDVRSGPLPGREDASGRMTAARDAREERAGSHTGPRVIGTGTDSSLLVDQAEPIIEEIEEEKVESNERPPNPRDPDDRHVH